MSIAKQYKALRTLPVPALMARINAQLELACAADNVIHLMLLGRKAKVISDFNDQQYGRSKKSLRGKIFTIHHAFVDGGHVTVWLTGCSCGAQLGTDIEILEL